MDENQTPLPEPILLDDEEIDVVSGGRMKAQPVLESDPPEGTGGPNLSGIS